MAWSKVWGREDSQEGETVRAITEFLRANPDVVRKFGQPHQETDDDNIWRWWEFAIFDGERWHTFHLNTSYEVSLEVGVDSSGDRSASADLLKLILQEVRAFKDANQTA